jgi:hypothetical protein
MVKYIFKNTFILFFLTGFFKHFIGWLSGLQHMYCLGTLSIFPIYIDFSNMFKASLESVGEGILFLVLSNILFLFLQNQFLISFIIGGGLHIVFEIIGIHTWFCRFYKNTQ